MQSIFSPAFPGLIDLTCGNASSEDRPISPLVYPEPRRAPNIERSFERVPFFLLFLSISFISNHMRTLLRNGAITNSFFSITSALFLMQWGGGGIFCGFVAHHSPLTATHFLVFSTTYEHRP